MARKKKHEEHINTEAWAIPYGDLVTLLFALFTVMYAVSSVNEGKFRVLSDSMIAAFRGAPKSVHPINLGEKEEGKGGEKPLVGIAPTALMKLAATQVQPPVNPNALGRGGEQETQDTKDGKDSTGGPGGPDDPSGTLNRMQQQVQDAMQSLIDSKMVKVKRNSLWLEVEINTDILFPSGSAGFSEEALPVLDKLAGVLKPFPNQIRVEGHTDDRPIRTAAFPSNWELSAARAASVVHEFTKAGVDPLHLEIVGFGEYRPIQANDSVAGRNANRRVAILILEQTAGGDSAASRLQAMTSNSAQSAAADAAGAENHTMGKAPAAELENTVLVKTKGKPDE
jgi:chemotaxis protein MotB